MIGNVRMEILFKRLMKAWLDESVSLWDTNVCYYIFINTLSQNTYRHVYTVCSALHVILTYRHLKIC